jgi:murein DD-endopeptidase MepM/ murein hydrolase activator NlpD
MNPKTHVAKNAHVFMVSTYLLAPMLFYPIPEPPVKSPEVPVEVTGGQGGGRWIPVEEEEPELNQFEALLSPRVLSHNILGGIKSVYYTGNSNTPPTVARENWAKVANTALPVTRNLITSTYGWRVPPCDGCSADHQGVDFVPGEGTPVFASLDGIVIDIGFNSSFGQFVVLEHVVPTGNGKGFDRWETVYAHLQRDSVPDGLFIGAIVERKQVIGKVGNTGQSTGPHLHFEIRINGVSVDPLPLLGNYQLIKVNMETGKHEIVYQ